MIQGAALKRPPKNEFKIKEYYGRVTNIDFIGIICFLAIEMIDKFGYFNCSDEKKWCSS